jgi:repressor LexA
MQAEAYQIAQALIEATILDRDRSLKIVESFRSIAVKPAESTTPQHSPSNSGSKARFTQTQGRYLAFIHRYMSKYGVAPAEADIQRHFLVSAPSVNAVMQTLTRRRLISRVPGKARSIQLLVPPEELPRL